MSDPDRKLYVGNHEDLLAAVRHLMGFQPAESIVVVSLTAGVPSARVDFPPTIDDEARVHRTLAHAYRQHNPGLVAMVCLTDREEGVDRVAGDLVGALERVGIQTAIRVWANEYRWRDLITDQAGTRDPSSALRIDAEATALGGRRPMASRKAVAESMVGDREPVAALLGVTRGVAAGQSDDTVRDWAEAKLEQFHHDSARLSDPEAARMLVALERVPVRDRMWADMDRDNTASHMALWTDLTRRAPDEVRTPAASMLAFSSWLRGDGATAWIALDQIPESQREYPMAALTAIALQTAIHPETWTDMRREAMDAVRETDQLVTLAHTPSDGHSPAAVSASSGQGRAGVPAPSVRHARDSSAADTTGQNRGGPRR